VATTFTYLRPTDIFGTAATGTVDATYNANWLIDGRPSYPARLTGSGAAWTITGTSQAIDFLAVGHHSLDAALSIAITGGITDTLTVPSYGANDIPHNAYKSIVSVPGVTTVTITITGNTGPAVIIGEVCFGTARTLPGTLSKHTGFRRNNFTPQRSLDRAWLPPYDKGMVAEEWTGTLLLTSAQRLTLLAWEESQRSGTRPSVVVLNSQAMWGFIEVGQQIPIGQLWKIDMRFVELPRTRW
jgi:hypothetical protein